MSTVQSLTPVWLCDPTDILQHARLPCPSPTPGSCSNTCPLSHWCHPTISSSVVPFSSRLQSFLTSGSFLMSQFFASGGQSRPKYWSFSFNINPSNEYSGLISFRMGWLDLFSEHLASAMGFPGGSEVKASAWNAGDPGFNPWVGKIPWRRKWQPTPIFLPGESHGWRSLVGYSSRGHKELDTTEQLHFSLWAKVMTLSWEAHDKGLEVTFEE